MSKFTVQIGLFVLSVVALVGVIVLAATSKPIPTDLWSITLVLVGAFAGITVPTSSAAKVNAPLPIPGVNVPAGPPVATTAMVTPIQGVPS